MEWEIIEDEKIKRDWLKWGNIVDDSVWDKIIERCDRVAEKLNLELTEFSDAKTSCWGFYRERYYAYFKKNNDELRAVVLEIVADNKISEVIEIRVATEKYIEEQLKEELKELQIA